MPVVKGFLRFYSNTVSPRQGVTKISNLVSGENGQSVRSPAASTTCKRTIKKRVKGADRREMLESFVNKYRAMNLGKFPSPTSAQKEVGGSYYLIKKMLQEMEYNFKTSPVDKGPTKENKKQIKGDNTLRRETAMESSGSQEKSNRPIDQNFCEEPSLEYGSNFDIAGNSNNARDYTHSIATNSDETPEQNLRDDNFSFKNADSKVEQQFDGTSNIRREEGELREKASLWGNLKSLANEFMNMWKK